MSGGAVREVVVDEHHPTDDQLLAARISLSEIDGMRGSDASCRSREVARLTDSAQSNRLVFRGGIDISIVVHKDQPQQ